MFALYWIGFCMVTNLVSRPWIWKKKLCYTFTILQQTRRLWATWKSSVTLIVILKDPQNVGRNSLKVNVRRRRNSHRNGRTKPRCRNCVCWEHSDQIVWSMPSSESFKLKQFFFILNSFTFRRYFYCVRGFIVGHEVITK